MAELNVYTTRKDVLRYTLELRAQLALFGIGITKSLERAMGHYLQVPTEPLYKPTGSHRTILVPNMCTCAVHCPMRV
jgi:hypothetical protein